jgi:putative membrane protein
MNPARAGFAQNRFLQILLGSYFLFWILLALHPLNRGDWFLENLLVFTTALVLVPTYRKFQLCNLSYALIVLFLTLHAVGAHYTYAKVPAGFWMADWFHLSRNHYDRVIHFGFGFLLLFPMRELMQRSAGARGQWAAWLALAALAALSGFFEILEAIIAQVLHSDLGTAYLGTQGDMWDAQKDMASAFLGAFIVALWLTFAHKRAAPGRLASNR